jgi:phosphinothricin acetyltransferase
MTEVELRDATMDDLPRIVDIYNAAIPGRLATADTKPVTVEQRVDWFRAHRSETRPLWVLTRDAETVGWLSLSDFYGRPAYAKTGELSVYVAPEHRGRGYGKLLLKRLVERSPSLGVETLLGFIFADNIASVKIHRALGFEHWGQLPKVAEIDGRKRDLLILGRKVAAGQTA